MRSTSARSWAFSVGAMSVGNAMLPCRAAPATSFASGGCSGFRLKSLSRQYTAPATACQGSSTVNPSSRVPHHERPTASRHSSTMATVPQCDGRVGRDDAGSIPVATRYAAADGHWFGRVSGRPALACRIGFSRELVGDQEPDGGKVDSGVARLSQTPENGDNPGGVLCQGNDSVRSSSGKLFGCWSRETSQSRSWRLNLGFLATGSTCGVMRSPRRVIWRFVGRGVDRHSSRSWPSCVAR